MSVQKTGAAMSSVDEVIEKFKNSNSLMPSFTGAPKRARDEIDADEAHLKLSAAVSSLRISASRFENNLNLYYCQTSSISTNSMRQMVQHLAFSASSTNGQFGIFLKIFAFKEFYESLVDSGNYLQVPVYEPDGREEGEELLKLRKLEKLEENLPNLVDGAKRALLELGFLTKNFDANENAQQQSLDVVYDENDEELNEIPEENPDEIPEEIPEPESVPEEGPDTTPEKEAESIDTYEGLINRVIDAIPYDSAMATRQLNMEAHSVFSHSYDYSLENTNGGASQPLPFLRSYFYRNASNIDDGHLFTSPANKNADLAAGFRTLILMCVIVAEEAKLDIDCAINLDLQTDATSDSRFQQTVSIIQKIHEIILDSEENGEMSIFKRASTLETLNTLDIWGTISSLSSSYTISESRSPLVDLFLECCQFIGKCIGARLSAGLPSSGHTTMTTVYPSPIFKLNTAEDHDDPKPSSDGEDSQETEVDE